MTGSCSGSSMGRGRRGSAGAAPTGRASTTTRRRVATFTPRRSVAAPAPRAQARFCKLTRTTKTSVVGAKLRITRRASAAP